jgi:peptide/nickel transport system ATP-binding protein
VDDARMVTSISTHFQAARRRTCIARSLPANPKFPVCDGPTRALDVSRQARIPNLMRDVEDRLEPTGPFLGHDLAVVRSMALGIGVMS